MEPLPASQFEAASPLPFRGGGEGGACQSGQALDTANTPHPNPSPKEEGLCPLAPTRHRDDGWTAERQRAFLERLAESGSVSEAARSVGMSRESAYALRRRGDARAFVQAWDAARALATEHLTEVAWDRALHGQVRPIYYHGELVGETRHYDNRLLLALIAQNRAAAGAVLPSADLVAAVAADWGGALDRAERGEPLAEPDPPALATQVQAVAAPLDPEVDTYGDELTEAQQLGIGCYSHWWHEDRAEWLTNWPAPAGFSGQELWVDETDTVLGPYDPDAPEAETRYGSKIERGYARTLTSEERLGLERREDEQERRRMNRLELYRRASFGIASAAERASIAGANQGNWQFTRPPTDAAD